MTRSIVLETRAIDDVAGYLETDLEGVQAVFAAIDGLVLDISPVASTRMGPVRRLRVGRYRVYYRHDDRTIDILRVGKAPAP